MFGDGFEQSTILRSGPDGLTRVITRRSWAERESVLVEANAAELVVLRRWAEFHREALGFMPRLGCGAFLVSTGLADLIAHASPLGTKQPSIPLGIGIILNSPLSIAAPSSSLPSKDAQRASPL
jgi:hypothetical protein